MMKLFTKIRNRLKQKLVHDQYLKLDRQTPLSVQVEHVHLGSANGGWFVPKVILEDRNEPKIVYGVGAGEDVSFDIDLAKRKNFKVFILDPTPRAIQHFKLLSDNTAQNVRTPINKSATDFYEISPEQLQNIRFLEFGVWSENCELKFFEPQNPDHVSHSAVNLQNTTKFFIAQCKTIRSIMEANGHEKVDLLKIDIEGAEYEVIKSILNDRVLPNIFCIEFDEMHSPKSLGFSSRVVEMVTLLRAHGYELTYKDRCNFTFCLKSFLHDSGILK